MKYLYLWLNLGSFLIPFLFSFHPRLRFYTKWKSLFPAIAIMMAIFIPWDIIFTHQGFWGFNEAYISGIHLFNLPIEEWLFFYLYSLCLSFYPLCIDRTFSKTHIAFKNNHIRPCNTMCYSRSYSLV